jgi:hypothetical protein
MFNVNFPCPPLAALLTGSARSSPRVAARPSFNGVSVNPVAALVRSGSIRSVDGGSGDEGAVSGAASPQLPQSLLAFAKSSKSSRSVAAAGAARPRSGGRGAGGKAKGKKGGPLAAAVSDDEGSVRMESPLQLAGASRLAAATLAASAARAAAAAEAVFGDGRSEPATE